MKALLKWIWSFQSVARFLNNNDILKDFGFAGFGWQTQSQIQVQNIKNPENYVLYNKHYLNVFSWTLNAFLKHRIILQLKFLLKFEYQNKGGLQGLINSNNDI